LRVCAFCVSEVPETRSKDWVLGVWALKRSLDVLCNLFIIEYMNKFDKEHQVCYKESYLKVCGFRVSEVPEKSPKGPFRFQGFEREI
jgi:hypothetical protein